MSSIVPVTDHLGAEYEHQEHQPAPFTWQPPEGNGPLFDTLRDDGGVYHCPWPECTRTSTGAQGLSRHLTFEHGWRTPQNRKPSHPKKVKKAPEKKQHPSDARRKEKVTCTFETKGVPCGRMIQRSYMRQHLSEYHHVTQAKLLYMANMASTPNKVPVSSLLDAPEVCLSVLESVAPDGMMPIQAMTAYQTWVSQTHDFLTVLYSREP